MHETLSYRPTEQQRYIDPELIDEIAHIATLGFLVEPLPTRSYDSLQRSGAGVVTLTAMPEFEPALDPRFGIPTESGYNAHQNQFALAT